MQQSANNDCVQAAYLHMISRSVGVGSPCARIYSSPFARYFDLTGKVPTQLFVDVRVEMSLYVWVCMSIRGSGEETD